MLHRLAGILVMAAVVTSCTVPDGSDGSGEPEPPASSSPSRSHSSPPSTSPADRAELDAGLVADLEAVLQAHEPSEVSLALAPVGPDARPRVVGDAPPLIAWSSIKVPLALAVVRSGRDASASIEAALTASDNAAAQRLWEGLGSGEHASDAVEEQLRRGGDPRTQVPAEVTVPGYSAFGQTTWHLRDQATFTAALPCLAGADPVTDAMGRVVGGQRWGLGGLEDARIKGGWGPTPDGYVVRQLGILPGAKGGTAAVLQVRTGTHEQGTGIMDELTAVLARHREDLPTGSCR